MMIATHLGTQAHEVTDDDLRGLMATIQTLLDAQARQRQEIIDEVRAQLAPIVEAAAIEGAMREKAQSRATIH